MSKSTSKEESSLDNLHISHATQEIKKLRFHPYYYQGRKGSYYKLEKRTSIKITKIEKNDDELVLTLARGKNNKIKLKSFWHALEFDYYHISCPDWKINFPKK